MYNQAIFKVKEKGPKTWPTYFILPLYFLQYDPCSYFFVHTVHTPTSFYSAWTPLLQLTLTVDQWLFSLGAYLPTRPYPSLLSICSSSHTVHSPTSSSFRHGSYSASSVPHPNLHHPLSTIYVESPSQKDIPSSY